MKAAMAAGLPGDGSLGGGLVPGAVGPATSYNDRRAQAGDSITAIIQPERFSRECILTSLQMRQTEERYLGFEALEEWQAHPLASCCSLIACWLPHADDDSRQNLVDRLLSIRDVAPKPRIALVSEFGKVSEAAGYIQQGVSAIVPVATSLEFMTKIFALVRAGGDYIPASLMRSLEVPREAVDCSRVLSPRQVAVARAVARGAPNKIIAHELAMCESTVKVHVRTIMKKLKAKNRTHIAYMLNDDLRIA